MAGKKQIIMAVLLLCINILLCVPAFAAQEPTFRLDTDSLNLHKGVSSTIVVSLVNAQDAQIVSIDGLEDFDIISQRQSTSTSIVNNSATYQMDVYFTIMPKVLGQYTLKANIKYNEQIYESNTLQVSVTDASQDSSNFVQDLFIKTVLSETEAYIGEKIVLTYELYSRYEIENYGFTDYIAIDGVIAKEIPIEQLKSESVYIDGNKYTMYQVKQFIIDPMKIGNCTIPSFNVQVNVITEGNTGGFGGFGGFGLFRSTTPKYLQTEQIEMTIEPLPAEGKPSDFSGIVGEMRIDGSYSRTEMNFGDSFTLTADISGSCNLDGLKNIVNGSIPGFTVYETQKSSSESVTDNSYYVQKTYELILIPENTGDLEISPVSIPYFNPVTGKYEKAEIPGASIKVLGEMQQTGSNSILQNGTVETVLIRQVSYSDTNNDYFSLQIKKAWVYNILIGFAILLIITACVTWLIIRSKKQNPEMKNLYKKIMESNDTNEIYNLFNSMIKHYYKLSIKASSKSAVISGLTDTSIAEQVIDIMDYMDSANAKDEKGYAGLKDKIRNLYTSRLRRIRFQ